MALVSPRLQPEWSPLRLALSHHSPLDAGVDRQLPAAFISLVAHRGFQRLFPRHLQWTRIAGHLDRLLGGVALPRTATIRAKGRTAHRCSNPEFQGVSKR